MKTPIRNFNKHVLVFMIVVVLLRSLTSILVLVIPVRTMPPRMEIVYQTKRMNVWISINSKGNNKLMLQHFDAHSGHPIETGSIVRTSKGFDFIGPKNSSPFGIDIRIPDDLTMRLKLIFGAPEFLLGLVIAYILYVLRKIFVSLESGSPFTKINARYIGLIAMTLIYVPIFNLLFNWVVQSYIASTFYTSFKKDLAFSGIDGMCMLGGFIFMALSFIIRKGVEMEQEQALTI